MAKHVSIFNNTHKLLDSIKSNWLWITVIVCIADLSSKYLVFYNFSPGEKVPLLPLLNLYYSHNYGAAFSFFSDISRQYRCLFIGIMTSVCVMSIITICHLRNRKKINSISCSLIVGGALGNLLDRLWHGFVIDMIDFYIGDWHFATFNFADSAIFIGTMLVVLEWFFPKTKFIKNQ